MKPMKPLMSESESQLYIAYEAVPFKDEYTITVTKFEPVISITRYFEIDLQINIEVEVKGPQGLVMLHGDRLFESIAEADMPPYRELPRIDMDDLDVKESHVEESQLEEFLRDIHDSRVEITFPTN